MHSVLTDDDIDFKKFMAETEAKERVKPASQFLNQVMHQLSPAHDAPKNPRMPFANCIVEFAPGEVTLWAGFNGSGKSMLQGQIMAEFANKGQSVCIASFEMKPDKTLARISRQMIGHAKPDKARVKEYLDSTDRKLWLYDQQGTVRPERLIAVIRYCASVLKIKHFAIDSLMKCVQDEDDYNAQKRFVDTLTAVARDFQIHIHLVHHLRKDDNEGKLPNKMDVKGSGAITDLVDNVLLIWRNKKKENDIASGKNVDKHDPDAMLLCVKQRNGDWEGRTKLYYSRTTMRFSDKPEMV